MNELGNIILPDIPRKGSIVVKSQYQLWRQGWEAAQPQFKIENVRHEYDPEWRTRIFSVQCARDLGHPIWVITKYAMLTGAMSFYAVKFMFL